MASTKYLQGKFTPRNPGKYAGDVSNIVYRSGYELAAFNMIDQHPGIIKWGSEEFAIPYQIPGEWKTRRYFVDLSILCQYADGSTKKFIVEIKPFSKTRPPKKTARMKESTYQSALLEWAQNSAKWEAAERFCAEHGATFIKWTEKEIFPEFPVVRGKRNPRKTVRR
jgi:hypothetical protein